MTAALVSAGDIIQAGYNLAKTWGKVLVGWTIQIFTILRRLLYVLARIT